MKFSIRSTIEKALDERSHNLISAYIFPICMYSLLSRREPIRTRSAASPEHGVKWPVHCPNACQVQSSVITIRFDCTSYRSPILLLKHHLPSFKPCLTPILNTKQRRHIPKTHLPNPESKNARAMQNHKKEKRQEKSDRTRTLPYSGHEW